VKVAYGPNGPYILRADGNYTKKDYADLRYTVVDLKTNIMDVVIDIGKTPSQICREHGAVIGGNCMFAFIKNGIYYPMGHLVKNEKLIQTTSAEKWADVILPKNGDPFIGQLNINNIKGIELAVSTTPQIAKDSKIFVNTWAEGTPADVKNNTRSKTGMGITKDKKIIYAVLDQGSYDAAFRIDEFAFMLIYLGADQALGFDSGNSCVFYADGKAQNYVAKVYGERATGSAVIFKPRPVPIIQRPVKLLKDILGLCPRIYKVYLAPSTQEHNVGVGGYNEEYWMHKIAEVLSELLASYSIEVKIGRKDQTLQQMVEESNSWGADLHFAIHSDAEDKGTARGATGFYFDGSTKSRKLCECIYNEIAFVTPVEDRGIKPGNHLYELRKTNAPACLVETSFHTNKEDVEFITTRYIELAEAAGKGVLKYLGFSF